MNRLYELWQDRRRWFQKPAQVPLVALPDAVAAEPSTAVNEPLQEQAMNVFQHIGKDIKGVFAWLGSDKGQRTVQTVETAAEITTGAIGGAGAEAVLDRAFNIVNAWGTEIVKSEAIATAAGQQNGTGTQKAAAVLNSMEPQLMDFLHGQNLTSAQVTAKAKTINDALVLVFKTMGGEDTSAPAAH